MATKKYNFTFFQDILREKRGGKYSSKKLWGFIVMVLLCTAFILDGLKFYDANENLFTVMATIGTTLIGLGTLNIFTKKSEEPELAPSDEEQR